MKKSLLLLGSLILVHFASAQSYKIVKTTGTSGPYTIFPVLIPGNPVNFILEPSTLGVSGLSDVQTIPFDFEFYGQAVSAYKASINGYLTFDTTAALRESNNTHLPDTAGPNQAIYAFWEELQFEPVYGGSIETWTYGLPPNRVHTIQWKNMSGLPVNNDLYFAIRLYECGTFDVVHNGFGNPNLTGTVGCENASGTEATELDGSPNLPFPTGGDNAKHIVYTFYRTPFDVAITNTNLGTTLLSGDHTLKGTIVNKGTSTINSFDLNYTIDGGNKQTATISGVNIPTGVAYNFTHDLPISFTETNKFHDICTYVDNLNSGNINAHPCNPEKCNQVFIISGVSGTKTTLLEFFSGSWCGYCPDGDVEVEIISNSHPDDFVPVAIHVGDDMELAAGNEMELFFDVGSYPSGMINRKYFSGEENENLSRDLWNSKVLSQIGSYTPANVSLSHTYDPASRTVDMTVTADFVDGAFGDLRFVAMITEDSVVGTGSGYNQVNYYNDTPGHPFYQAGDPIKGYVHDWVARAMPSGGLGNAGIIPKPTFSATQYSENFSYVLPASWDEKNINLIGFVAYYSTRVGGREILDVATAKLVETSTALQEIPALVKDILLFPNPVDDQIHLSFGLTEKTVAHVGIFDPFGRSIRTFDSMDFLPGTQKMTYDVTDLTSGIYFISIVTNTGKTFTRRFEIIR